jgi:hypothetical protein
MGAADPPRLFELAAVPVASERLADLVDAAGAADRMGRLDELADALAAGVPDVAEALVQQLAAELEADTGSHGPELPALVYRAGVATRLQRPDFGEAMAAIEERLEQESGAGNDWGETDEGQMYLQGLAAGLVPLAGLDLEAALAHTRTFLANFPAVSLPFGDVDQRAARWLAQLLDVGSTRAALRDLLARLAGTWHQPYPRAAAQTRAWAAGRAPADPTQDRPWVRALVALARTQL